MTEQEKHFEWIIIPLLIVGGLIASAVVIGTLLLRWPTLEKQSLDISEVCDHIKSVERFAYNMTDTGEIWELRRELTALNLVTCGQWYGMPKSLKQFEDKP